MELSPGVVIAGKYRLEGELGRGGFGTVWRASHTDLGTKVALKLLRSEVADDDEAQQRFLREMELAQKLVHHYAVPIRDCGRDRERDLLYFTMDLIEGPTLLALQEELGTLPPERVVPLVCQALQALGRAHQIDLVHRDLKPANLLVTTGRGGKEEIRVADFGIAKAVSQAGGNTTALTLTGTTIGTLAYMSPEQADGSALDGRSDLYSLGVVLFEALSGKRPVEANPGAENTQRSFLTNLMIKAPRDLAELAPGLPRSLCDAVMKALAKSPQDRHADAEAMAKALEAALEPPIRTPAEETDSFKATRSSPAETFSFQETRGTELVASTPRSRTKFLVLGLLLAVAGLGVTAFVLRDDPADSSTPVTQKPETKSEDPPAKTLEDEPKKSVEKKSSKRPSAVDRIRQRGTLLVALDTSYPPFATKEKDGSLTGYDVDVAREIARDLGVRLKIRAETQFAQSIYLDNEMVDAIVSGAWFIDPAEPSSSGDTTHSEPYAKVGQAILKQRSEPRIQRSADLNQPGLVIATLSGEVGEATFRRSFARATRLSFPTAKEACEAVLTGRADAAVLDWFTLAEFLRSRKTTPLVGLWEPFAQRPVAVIVLTKKPTLLQAINQTIARLKKSGKLAELGRKHFGLKPTTVAEPKTKGVGTLHLEYDVKAVGKKPSCRVEFWDALGGSLGQRQFAFVGRPRPHRFSIPVPPGAGRVEARVLPNVGGLTWAGSLTTLCLDHGSEKDALPRSGAQAPSGFVVTGWSVWITRSRELEPKPTLLLSGREVKLGWRGTLRVPFGVLDEDSPTKDLVVQAKSEDTAILEASVDRLSGGRFQLQLAHRMQDARPDRYRPHAVKVKLTVDDGVHTVTNSALVRIRPIDQVTWVKEIGEIYAKLMKQHGLGNGHSNARSAFSGIIKHRAFDAFPALAADVSSSSHQALSQKLRAELTRGDRMTTHTNATEQQIFWTYACEPR